MADGEPEYDLVVVGSGAAGMTAALTAALHGLRAVVIEKTEYFGGSTARSGGGVWIPGNAVLRRAGICDTPEEASAYLAHVAGESVPASLRDAFLEHGPVMLDLVLANTPVQFAWVPNYADYYPEAPGGKASGRSIEPVPLDARVLGAELAHLRPPYLPAPAGHHGDAGQLPVDEPRHLAPAGDLDHRQGDRPDDHHQGAQAHAAEHGAGADHRPAGRAGEGGRAGLAEHPDDRPGDRGRPRHRRAGDQGRGAGRRPGRPGRRCSPPAASR